jgi:ribosomal protein L16 Arg81 hydroxylase
VKELIEDYTLIEELRNARQHRKPWLGKGAIKNLERYFSVGDFENLIKQRGIWSPDKLQVFLDNQAIPPGTIFESQQTSAGQKPEISLEKLKEAIGRGCSVILNDVCPLSLGLMRLRETLADLTRGKLECNVYFSQKDHQAFPIHYDVHDVFAIQVYGKKHWQIFEQKVEYPINHPMFTNRAHMNPDITGQPPSLDFDFEEGDVVFIPSGFLHHATCRDGQSLHLSFGLVEMIGLDIISLAFEAAIHEKFFRTPVNSILRERDPVGFYLQKWAKQLKDLSADPEFRALFLEHLTSFRYPPPDISPEAKPTTEEGDK